MEDFSAYGYYGLTASEKWILEQYFEYGQKWHIAQYIKRQPECINGGLSQGMSNFVADLIMGKAARKNVRASTQRRDQFIYYHFCKLILEYPGIPLISSQNKTGISELLQPVFNMEESALVKAYQRIRKSKKFPNDSDIRFFDGCPCPVCLKLKNVD